MKQLTILKSLKKIRPMHRNWVWLSSGISLPYKLLYYPEMLFCYLRMIVFKNRYIHYLGVKFSFDNFIAPLTLQTYPYEISNKLLKNIDASSMKSVLDIGGNIGQFSVTLSRMVSQRGSLKIDVFEPNKHPYSILKENTKGINNISIYCNGVGNPKQKIMYFEPGRSGIASVHKNNAGKKEKIEEVDIDLIKNVASVTKKSNYDLIKIDVEGYEYEVIESIAGVKTRYMFIEISGARFKTFSHSEFYTLISKKFGKFDILYQSAYSQERNIYDTLLEFKS